MGQIYPLAIKLDRIYPMDMRRDCTPLTQELDRMYILSLKLERKYPLAIQVDQMCCIKAAYKVGLVRSGGKMLQHLLFL